MIDKLTGFDFTLINKYIKEDSMKNDPVVAYTQGSFWFCVKDRPTGYSEETRLSQLLPIYDYRCDECGNPIRLKAKVILFKHSGKYYSEEEWEIPTKEEVIERGGMPGDSVGPFCMKYSKDYRHIGGDGPVLVITQEPWGYPHLLFP
jgi:hypothetical protein